MQFFFWIFLFINVNPIVSYEVPKTLPLVDALLSILEKEKWNDDQVCLQATLELLKGVQNNTLWATWIWDSMQLPCGTFHDVTTHLGHFDQCTQFPWSSSHPRLQPQYCVVEVTTDVTERKEFGAFDRADDVLQSPSKYGRYSNVLEVGTCLPALCSTNAVAKIYKHIHRFTHLPDGQVALDPRDCQTIDTLTGHSRKFYLFWCLIGILITTAIFSTYWNKYTSNQNRTHLNLITQSFCLKRNYNGLFEANKNDIRSLNGVRFVAAFSIVLIHDSYYTTQAPIVNARSMDENLVTFNGSFMLQICLVVDTFFVLSGLLLVRNLITSTHENLLVNLLKRYIRLIGPFAFVILYINMALIDLANGPYWPKATRVETDVCQEYWWKSLLAINNRPDTTCHIVSWHMASDYQLSVIMTVIFYLFRKNKKLGVSLFIISGVAMNLYLAFDVYRKNLPYYAFENVARMNIRKDTTIMYHYLMTHCHSASYFIGGIAGYIMANYNPAEYRKVINRKLSKFLLLVARILMIGTLLSGVLYPRPYNAVFSAAVVPLCRVTWATGICLFVAVCEYGSLRKLTDSVSWRGFIPLSNLTYGIYLIHPFLIQKDKLTGRSLVSVNNFVEIKNGCGALMLSCLFSLVFYLIIEAPIVNLSKSLLGVKSRQNNMANGGKTSHSEIVSNNEEIKTKIT